MELSTQGWLSLCLGGEKGFGAAAVVPVDNQPRDSTKPQSSAAILRNVATGETYVWLMTDATHTGGFYLEAVSDTNWKVLGVGGLSP